ncbi:aminotransferase [Clostridium sporogenes]|jgi:aspartate/methionine/tyrosine aminotransferase|uniref:Aminotransferase n=3 Tax=Clostridium TaxID=1485 RepID=A0AAE5C8V3_CLOSG|nr:MULTISPECIES: aminotransferase [Clostridium]MBE6076771.1 aminotransferase [Clostridium lundense]AVQ40299.1 aminotransferase [Clostridium botulinum]EDU38950.1 putative transaminase [Clostridium sporogenes ATCC 15579]KIS23075.1 aminotransferase [Clostridium botulinum B2 450]MCW6095471.1 aminotransferase [Clostridium sporogenes]
MKIKTFKVEQWMNQYENDAIYNLAETCIDSLTLRELLNLAGKNFEEYMVSLGDIRMTYSHIYGSPNLLKGIASLFQDVKAEQIIPTHGAIGANYQVLITLLEPGDSMVSVAPTYQQHYSIPESMGTEVNILKLLPENNFLPDLQELKKMVNSNTKLITINNPNNPSGSLIPVELIKQIVDIAKSVDAYVLSDEVYRGISEDGSYMPSIVDLYEKGISVGSMSKTFSLAGLRLGWIVSKDEKIINLCRERRDYDTISCGVLDDIFASLALENKEAILERNRKIVMTNRELLHQWVSSEPRVSYVKPVAGNTALIYYDADMHSYEFCEKLLKETGVFYTPGECFDLDYCFRIGYAFDSKTLMEGLEKTSKFISNLPRR